jgi:hypothetical protein
VTPQLPGIFGTLAPLLDSYGYLAVGGLLFVEDFGVPARGRRSGSPPRSTLAPGSSTSSQSR